MATVKPLDKSTIQSLHSGQVIIDLEAIVKELIENSLDANATAIDFIFKNNGLDSIQVKDNGDGIAECDRLSVAKCHYTSKIQAFHDLETIETYGFRGEAINAICAISDQFTIMTKTNNDTIGKQYTIDKNGNISNEKPTNVIPTSGTLILVQKPFYDLPVRRQIAMKQASNNMKKIQELLVKYALAHPNVRFSSQSTAINKNMWIKPVTSSIESTMTILFDASFTDMLEHFLEADLNHPTLSVDVILPKANSDPSMILKGPDRIYIYVNGRPINYIKSELKDIVTLIRNRYRDTIGLTENTSKKTPFIYLNIKISPNEYDVNIEPNKTTILFHNKQLIFNLIETKILDKIYPSKAKQFFQPIIPNENVAPVTDIPTATTTTTKTTTTNDNLGVVAAEEEHNWSFTMDDSLEELDELLSDSESEEQEGVEHLKNIVTPTTLDQYYVSTTKPADNSTPTLTNHMISPSPPAVIIRPSQPSAPNETTPNINNTITTEKSFIPKKRNIQVLEEDDEEESSFSELTISSPKLPSTAPLTQQRIHTSRVNSLQNTTSKPPSKLPATSTTISLPAVVPRPNVRVPTNEPSRNKTTFKKPTFVNQLRDTINETMIIDCNIEDIKSNYPRRKEILSETYRISIDEYLNNNNYHHPHKSTSLIHFPKGTLHEHLSLYTQKTPSTLDKHRQQIYQLGVVKLKSLSVEATIQKLTKEYKLICKKPLERPVQIQMNYADHLFPVLINLKSKEQFVNNDLHGQEKITYSEVIDETVLNNGFKVRWRKDLYSGNLIIQFTCIYSLGSGYGPSDFRELLALMMKKTNDQSIIRPRKVMDHIHSLAQQIHNNQSNDSIADHLEEALNQLIWKKDGEWELGYGSDNKVLACMLAGSQQD